MSSERNNFRKVSAEVPIEMYKELVGLANAANKTFSKLLREFIQFALDFKKKAD
jgi:predicted DNA-binding protein